MSLLEEQKTINKSFTLEGKGLQTGKPVKVFFYPEEAHKGIIFVRSDLKDKPAAHLGDLLDLDTDRRSKINFAGTHIETVEHILAALWGAGVDNIRIELDSSEPPALDGSSLEFLKALKTAGLRAQNEPRKFIEIKEPLWREAGEAFLGIFPSSAFKISYILEYPGYPLGRQFFSRVLNSDIFEKEIAPARTIWLVPPGPGSIESKAKIARGLGYGRGATEENVLIIARDGLANSARFPDEPVRHKVLDLIGDLYLLGSPLKGRIIAVRSGHKLNLALVRKIRESE